MSQLQESELPYKERTGVFFGGSSGTGLSAAVEYQKLGGNVILGASSESSFRRALANVRYAGGNRETIKPLIGNVTNRMLLQANIENVITSQIAEGQPVTDFFSFAAAGMPFAIQLDSDYFAPMRSIIAENPSNRNELLEAKKAELRRQYAIWLPASRDEAIEVNVNSKITIIAALLRKSSDPITFIDFNSTFGKEGKGPLFYGNVLTKHEFSIWMERYADDLADAGIDAAEITAPVVEDTDVGKIILNKITPLLPPEIADLMVRTKVTRVDVFKAMKDFLDMTREERAQEGRPYERYVIGDNGNISIVKTIPEELRIDSSQFDI